jgi:hypothetical protein
MTPTTTMMRQQLGRHCHHHQRLANHRNSANELGTRLGPVHDLPDLTVGMTFIHSIRLRRVAMRRRVDGDEAPGVGG